MSSKYKKKVIMIDNPFDIEQASILDYPFINESMINNQSHMHSKEGASIIQIGDLIQSNISLKSINQTKFHNHSFISNISSSQFIGSLYEKNQQRQFLHNSRLERERSQKKYDELKELQSHPQMNDISRQIVKEKYKKEGPDYIHSYMYKNKITKANKIHLKDMISKESNMKEHAITQKTFNQKSFDLFLRNNEVLLEKRKKKTNSITIECEIDSYSPMMNKKSREIVELSKKNTKALTASNSLYHTFIETPLIRSKVKRVLQKYNEKQNITFTPKLSKIPPLKRSPSASLYFSNKSTSPLSQSSINPNSIQSTPYNNHFINQDGNIFKERLLKLNKSNIKPKLPQNNNSMSMLYKLNISNNTSTHDAYSIVSLNPKHLGILDLQFAS